MKIKTNIKGKKVTFIPENMYDAFKLGKAFINTTLSMTLTSEGMDMVSISVDVDDVVNLMLKRGVM